MEALSSSTHVFIFERPWKTRFSFAFHRISSLEKTEEPALGQSVFFALLWCAGARHCCFLYGDGDAQSAGILCLQIPETKRSDLIVSADLCCALRP